MNKQQHNQTLLSWLKVQLVKSSNGIVLEGNRCCHFDSIQDFIETCDHTFKTPVIYYEAFPQESAAEFFSTLHDELVDKLGNSNVNQNQSLLAVIQASALKMLIIDKSHLHPLDTLNNILDFFAKCNVCLVLIGPCNKMKIAQILNHPIISTWPQFAACEEYNPAQKFVNKN